jgi:hypothetical protein
MAMTPFQEDMFDILRRICERGKRAAENTGNATQLDLWIHMLDELRRLRESV